MTLILDSACCYWYGVPHESEQGNSGQGYFMHVNNIYIEMMCTMHTHACEHIDTCACAHTQNTLHTLCIRAHAHSYQLSIYNLQAFCGTYYNGDGLAVVIWDCDHLTIGSVKLLSLTEPSVVFSTVFLHNKLFNPATYICIHNNLTINLYFNFV